MKVFLSHNSKDKPVVRNVAGYLESQGFAVWLDEWEMTPGDSLVDKISKGVEAADKLVVFLTPDSVDSNWVAKEVNGGIIMEVAEEKGLGVKFVIPVLLKACKVPFMLREKLYADFTSLSFEQACESLVDGLRGNARRREFEPYSNASIVTHDLGQDQQGNFNTALEFTSNLSPIAGITLEIVTGGYLFADFRVGQSNKPVREGSSMPLFNGSRPFRDGVMFSARFSAPELKPGISCYVVFTSKEPLDIKKLAFLDGFGRDI